MELFQSTGFEIGETLSIPSPYPESFISLTIPAHKGLPRIGKQHTYEGLKKINIQEYNKTKQERIAVREWQRQNLGVYGSLIVLNLMQDHVQPNEMLERFKLTESEHSYFAVNGRTGPHYSIFRPRAHIEGLAAGTLVQNLNTTTVRKRCNVFRGLSEESGIDGAEM